MSLPSSGAISMSQVAAELGISASGLSLNDGRVRALSGLTDNISSGNNFNALHAKTRFVITAGQDTTSSTVGGSTLVTYTRGYSSGRMATSMGAKTPLTDTRYANFELYDTSSSVYLTMVGAVPRGAFTSIDIFGIAYYDSSLASYFSDGNYSQWVWAKQNNGFANGVVYSVYMN